MLGKLKHKEWGKYSSYKGVKMGVKIFKVGSLALEQNWE